MASSKTSTPTSTCSSSDSICKPKALSLGKLPLFGFLALLFMLALVINISGLIVYRRRRRQAHLNSKIDSSPIQPQFFERHLCSQVSACGSKYWDTIMPLSVKYKSAIPDSELGDRRHGVEHTLLPTWGTSSRTFKRQFAPPPLNTGIASSEMASRRGVQIAHIISMPTRERLEGLFEIGIMEVDLSKVGDK
ncbi:hypothetical protein C8R45DRAFT_964836 [Mycena sanguinolenta]|nr:hypothetical protein C8R45DRAFT_964836 [Mycena sanguinolenta]